MATSGDRKSVFASSKFSHRTRETYSGSKAISAGLSPQPRVLLAPLSIGRARDEFEPPPPRRFSAERQRNVHELFAPRDQERDRVARPVLLEAVLESIGAHAEIVNRQDLIVDVET